ncbi:MAG: chemotaxis protein CheD [Candidatus Nitrosotenuis sp.]|uniref:Probable chemoreceptor glutamine deamidase CheD n=1 Tax=Candidatus Nitrosotenuis uzonensis TaxID=1407055 RepID=V6AR64_9ARCH|nr:chemotaxis protein CheD [Candidatus Nitrosotenuis uzonensis]CAE6491887.1 Chemoreceptor glutamine deamidase CheD [Candidatus Nitrosotenuis uzonensis]CDI04908.1 Chemoreceptor glutamine deamidase CheD [Candidatus Nitrosotenuis uzonensis]
MSFTKQTQTSNIVEVPMGGLLLTTKEKSILQTFVGSCVAICLYDSVAGVAGMAHIMLPKNNTQNPKPEPEGKFADVAMQTLLDKLIASGANIARLKAKMAGGANVFQNESKSNMFNIGMRNVETIKTILAEKKIQLVSEDVGSKHGRWVIFDLDSGQMKIKDREKGMFVI